MSFWSEWSSSHFYRVPDRITCQWFMRQYSTYERYKIINGRVNFIKTRYLYGFCCRENPSFVIISRDGWLSYRLFLKVVLLLLFLLGVDAYYYLKRFKGFDKLDILSCDIDRTFLMNCRILPCNLCPPVSLLDLPIVVFIHRSPIMSWNAAP